MSRIAPVTPDSIDEKSAKSIEESVGDWRNTWNVIKTIANAPAALRIFHAIHLNVHLRCGPFSTGRIQPASCSVVKFLCIVDFG